MSRILVVYCSRSGNTRRIAHEIAEACDAEIDEIVDTVGRGGPLGYLRSAVEALLGILPPIRRAGHAPKAYELVVIGTPVWFWNIASPVRAYVHAHRSGLRRVAVFCTYGGSGHDKVLADLQRLCGQPAVATLALTERQTLAPERRKQIAKFVRELEHAGAGPSRARVAVHA